MSVVRFDCVTVDEDTGEVLVGNNVAAHTSKARAVVLGLLMASNGRVVSTARVLDALWGDRAEGPTIKAVQVYICHLRAMLRDHKIPLEIRTHWGRGYSVYAT